MIARTGLLLLCACATPPPPSAPAAPAPAPVQTAPSVAPLPADPFADGEIPGKLTPEEAAQISSAVVARNAAARRAAWEGAMARFRVVDGRVVDLSGRLPAPEGLIRGLPQLMGPEALLSPPAGATAPFNAVLFVPDPTPPPESCAPRAVASHYVGARADGSEAIVRLRPEVTSHALHIAGTCGVGCGQPPLPSRPYGLQVRATASTLEVIDVPYEETEILTTCDEMRPLP